MRKDNYRKNGEPTVEIGKIRVIMRSLKQSYGRTPVSEFGPLALKTLRQAMIDAGHSRGHINEQIARVKRVFKWGVENELIPSSVYHALQAVSGLRKGRSAARETEPVRPAPEEHINAVEPFVSRQVWAMIQLQLLTGIATRSGQVVLYQLTDHGRGVASSLGVDPGPPPRASLEHRYWVRKVHRYFEAKGYEVSEEHAIKGDGVVDLVAERPGERLAVEIETGKSDIKMNLRNALAAKFDRVVLVAASPAGVAACQRAVGHLNDDERGGVELMTWLDVS